MKLLDRSIDRPLPVFLAAALVVVLGLWCLSELPINRTPKIEIPFTVVSSVYEGAAPDEVEAEVTIELEEELNTIANLKVDRCERSGLAHPVICGATEVTESCGGDWVGNSGYAGVVKRLCVCVKVKTA